MGAHLGLLGLQFGELAKAGATGAAVGIVGAITLAASSTIGRSLAEKRRQKESAKMEQTSSSPKP